MSAIKEQSGTDSDPVLLTRVARPSGEGRPETTPATGTEEGGGAARDSQVADRLIEDISRPRVIEASEQAALPSAPWPRWPNVIEINFHSDHNFFGGFSLDLARCGIFVATYRATAIGEPMMIDFTVPGLEREVTALCQSAWHREHGPRTAELVPGIGFRFRRLDQETARAVLRFMRHREPVFWEG